MARPTFAVLPFSILEDKRLGGSDKLVLMALLKWGLAKRYCFPKDESIADAAGITRRTAQASLANLIALGFIEKAPDKSNPTGRRFLLTWMDDPKYAALFKPREPKGRGATWAPGVSPNPGSRAVIDWVKRRWKELPGDDEDKDHAIFTELCEHDHDEQVGEVVEKVVKAIRHASKGQPEM